MAASVGAELLVWRNEAALAAGTNPIALDTKRCCGLLKTQALLDGLNHHGFTAAFGGARRDEEKSRAKERIYSFRDRAGQWDPKNQRPELWNLYNSRIHPGESIRVFPLSNWTEMDVWQYILEESIPIVDLYFAKDRPMYLRGDALLPTEQAFVARRGEEPVMVRSRLRSLGCSPCTGAIRSDADTLPKIIEELLGFRSSERANRAIDHDQEGSMELKKREGYF
jgi:sulfate adenylyltransferase subunit 2